MRFGRAGLAAGTVGLAVMMVFLMLNASPIAAQTPQQASVIPFSSACYSYPYAVGVQCGGASNAAWQGAYSAHAINVDPSTGKSDVYAESNCPLAGDPEIPDYCNTSETMAFFGDATGSLTPGLDGFTPQVSSIDVWMNVSYRGELSAEGGGLASLYAVWNVSYTTSTCGVPPCGTVDTTYYSQLGNDVSNGNDVISGFDHVYSLSIPITNHGLGTYVVSGGFVAEAKTSSVADQNTASADFLNGVYFATVNGVAIGPAFYGANPVSNSGMGLLFPVAFHSDIGSGSDWCLTISGLSSKSCSTSQTNVVTSIPRGQTSVTWSTSAAVCGTGCQWSPLTSSGSFPDGEFVIVNVPFQQQVQVTISSSTSNSNFGTVTPSGTNWYPVGTPFQASAIASNGATFTGWTTGGTSPISIWCPTCTTTVVTINSYVSGAQAQIVGEFSVPAPVNVAFSYSVAGAANPSPGPTLSYTSGGASQHATLTTSSANYLLDTGSPWSATNPITITQGYERWVSSDPGGTASPSVTSVVVPYQQQYYLSIQVASGESSAGSITTTVNSWNNYGSNFAETAAANSGYQFTDWTVSSVVGQATLTCPTDPTPNCLTSPSIVVSAAFGGSVTANFRIPTQLQLSGSAGTISAGTQYTLVAELASQSGFVNTPETVSFYYGSGTLVNSVQTISGTASYSWVITSAGTYSFYASFGGDGTYGPSTSSTTSVQVLLDPTTLTLSVAPSTVSAGGTVTFTATLTDQHGNEVSGQVINFYPFGSLTKIGVGSTGPNGVATFTYKESTVGTFSYVATFGGNGEVQLVRDWSGHRSRDILHDLQQLHHDKPILHVEHH